MVELMLASSGVANLGSMMKLRLRHWCVTDLWLWFKRNTVLGLQPRDRVDQLF